LLKLLGRYDGLALDSWTRAKFFQVRNNGRKANDKKIARYYSRFNEWRGLALWCDVTRDWLVARKDQRQHKTEEEVIGCPSVPLLCPVRLCGNLLGYLFENQRRVLRAARAFAVTRQPSAFSIG
jgi:hypothetical protein